jgi:diadenosine tetraphosphate (Ap4A) HIT family hydrolase
MTAEADCPFCHPDIKRSVFAEEGKFWAIYNIAPILPGHCLVIPKTHVDSVMSLSEEELGQFIIFARQVTKTILQAFDASGFDWPYKTRRKQGRRSHICICTSSRGHRTIYLTRAIGTASWSKARCRR